MDHHEENEKMGRPSSFSEAHKREAVAQAAASGNISPMARALGISIKDIGLRVDIRARFGAVYPFVPPNVRSKRRQLAAQ